MDNVRRLFAGALAGALIVASLAGVRGVAMAATGGFDTTAAITADPGLSGHSDSLTGNDDSEQGGTARAAGVATGQIVAIDYQRGVVSVLTQQLGRIDVQVLPSTNIHGRGDAFLSIGDLNRGSRVEMFLSTINGRYVAQIIRLL